MSTAVLQEWVLGLKLMQQTVLLTAVRGPDGLPKYGPVKFLLRWFRRCILLSAMDRRVLSTPWEPGGGSFTGPSVEGQALAEAVGFSWEPQMNVLVDQYLRDLDAIPHHFQLHFMHAAEIVGFKHPDDRIRKCWREVYWRLVEDMHLYPETEDDMDSRLGDDESGWLKRADPATRS